MPFFKSRTAWRITCIAISLLICFGLTPLFNAGVSKTTRIVRVTKDIKPGEKITAGSVGEVSVGGYNLPQNVVRNTGEVVGKYAKVELVTGDYILGSKISVESVQEDKYLYNLNGSKQAISISIKNFSNGLLGKLIPGDIVSVILPNYKDSGEAFIPPEL